MEEVPAKEDMAKNTFNAITKQRPRPSAFNEIGAATGSLRNRREVDRTRKELVMKGIKSHEVRDFPERRSLGFICIEDIPKPGPSQERECSSRPISERVIFN